MSSTKVIFAGDSEYVLDSSIPVLGDVGRERWQQHQRWGKQDLTYAEWIAVLGEEYGEAAREAVELFSGRNDDTADLRAELVQLAAVAVQIIEAIDEAVEG